MEDESKGKLKRTRAPSNGAQVPPCLVDGCDSDLSKCRDYHRRHKVCELHSKTPKVTIAGQEQRFCQQCSRSNSECIEIKEMLFFSRVVKKEMFHSLVEFDEGKRSCRKRLDGHNRRRRKPQPESMSTDSGKFISTYQGTRVLPFHSPHMFSSTAMSSALAASGTVKAENDLILYNSNSQLTGTRKQLFPASATQIYIGEKQLSLLQGTDCINFPEASVCQPLLDADPATQKVFSTWLYRDVDPDCALSLLSSTPTDTKEIGLSHIMQSNQTPMAQSLISSLHYKDLETVGEPTSSILATHGGSNANLHYQEMYRINKPDGSSSSGSHQALSFSWE